MLHLKETILTGNYLPNVSKLTAHLPMSTIRNLADQFKVDKNLAFQVTSAGLLGFGVLYLG
jgi:hypothetical protein